MTGGLHHSPASSLLSFNPESCAHHTVVCRLHIILRALFSHLNPGTVFFFNSVRLIVSLHNWIMRHYCCWLPWWMWQKSCWTEIRNMKKRKKRRAAADDGAEQGLTIKPQMKINRQTVCLKDQLMMAPPPNPPSKGCFSLLQQNHLRMKLKVNFVDNEVRGIWPLKHACMRAYVASIVSITELLNGLLGSLS